MVTAGLMSGGLSIVSGIFGASAANKRRQQAAHERRVASRKLQKLEDNRQEIINPYEGSTDLSSMIQNPFDNLAVATQAAEMQAEQADISLANTLDAVRSTGAGAGGATALAQAALQSKKGVSASIEQQEVNNEKLKAQGEQRSQQLQMAEKQRMQTLEASGKEFMYREQENRERAQMDRISAQIAGAQAREAQASSDVTGAITGAVGGAVSTVGGMYSAGAFDSSSTTPSTISMGNYDLSSFGTGINTPNLPTTQNFYSI
jgi:hypothetical protein